MNITILISIVTVLTIITVILVLISYSSEREDWNYGICSYCQQENWELFDVDRHGTQGYKCPKCKCTIWLSWTRLTKNKARCALNFDIIKLK